MNRSPSISAVIAVLQVAAVYVYFLLFDQFGFLSHLHDQGLGPNQVQIVMLAMGVGGLIGSFATAWLVDPARLRVQMLIAWTSCAVAALVSVLLDSVALLVAEGLLIGLTTGAITVLVASSLRELVVNGRLGLCIGLGTGVAYAVANTPALFDGSLIRIAGLSVALSLAAGIVMWLYLPSSVSAHANDTSSLRSARWPWVLGLAILVCLDSGAFAMLQQDEVLKSWTWGPADHKLWLAIVHATAAVAAGILLERGFRFSMIITTWLLFALAFTVIPFGLPDALPAALIYACGISMYSVVLVAAPSLMGGNLRVRARQAAWLFGVSGWVGSAAGIGMAQDFEWVPMWFLLATGGMLAAMAVFLNPPVLGAARRAFGLSVAVLLLCGLWLAFGKVDPLDLVAPPVIDAEDEVMRGAEVYRREGCINCHSQYIRPGGPDEITWGPYSPIDRTEQPPFVGNRRQGPDLKNVGLRRSAEWQRLHLADPRLVSPGSRMPSYAHLFRDGCTDGDDLVAYLNSRGERVRDTFAEQASAWSPAELMHGSPDRGSVLFRRHCATCHGTQGRGDGPAASRLNPRPRDLTTSAYIMSRPDREGDPLAAVLARIVKYGISGTSMPGHEVLTDAEVADVVHYVASLGRELVEHP